MPRDEFISAIKKTKNYRKEENMENLLDMYNRELIEKEIKKMKENSSSLLEDYKKDIMRKGIQEERHKTALRLLAENLDIFQISQFIGLSVKEIKKLKKE